MKTFVLRIGLGCLTLATGVNLLSAPSSLDITLAASQPVSPAARAINALGIDLLRRAAPDANALLSPYSIQSALAMTYGGADGLTHDEMARVLHYSKNETELHSSFATLRKALSELVQNSETTAQQLRQLPKYGVTNDSIALAVANRLFGQTGYDFREPFLNLLKTNYAAPLEPLDFVKDSSGAMKLINNWVEEQTRQRIQNLIPDGALSDLTRLVLVNAIYLKAAWVEPFKESQTRPGPFHLAGGKSVDVPTMMQQHKFPYQKRDGYSVVGLPYFPRDLQFLILLPDKPGGLPALESQLTPEMLLGCANLDSAELILSLPKFKLQPPLMPLGKELKALGMKTAFDDPQGSANFDRMAPRRPGDYLYISEVFHKTFLDLDEKGTEAAAATAIYMNTLGFHTPQKPIVVSVDRPFLFAIEDTRNGTCLFLGHVADPR